AVKGGGIHPAMKKRTASRRYLALGRELPSLTRGKRRAGQDVGRRQRLSCDPGGGAGEDSGSRHQEGVGRERRSRAESRPEQSLARNGRQCERTLGIRQSSGGHWLARPSRSISFTCSSVTENWRMASAR